MALDEVKLSDENVRDMFEPDLCSINTSIEILENAPNLAGAERLAISASPRAKIIPSPWRSNRVFSSRRGLCLNYSRSCGSSRRCGQGARPGRRTAVVLLRGERSGTDRAGYHDWTGLLGPPRATAAVRRTPSGGITYAAVLV